MQYTLTPYPRSPEGPLVENGVGKKREGNDKEGEKEARINEMPTLLTVAKRGQTRNLFCLLLLYPQITVSWGNISKTLINIS